MEKLKVLLVYDWGDKWGGAERLILAFKDIFPNLTLFTSYADKKRAFWLNDFEVKESFLKKFPRFIKANRTASLLFYPFAFESFKFDGYDVVISVSSYFAKSVITKPDVLHISYILTPPRFLWGFEEEYLKGVKKRIASPILSYFRKWDFLAAQRADVCVVISNEVARRVKKYYGRDATVIYPPFDLEYWSKVYAQTKKIENKFLREVGLVGKKYFLFVGRLEPYKRADLFVQVAKYFEDYTFVLVGKGSLEKKIKKVAFKNTLFLKDLSDKELGVLYSNAEALIMPQREEFGYTALESIFFKTPVIFFEKSGAAEIVEDLGLSFSSQDVRSLQKAIEKYITVSYNLKIKKDNFKKVVEKFNKDRFKKEFISLVQNHLNQ